MKPTTLAYEMPDTTEVANLLVERMNETTLRPDSPVLCLNRGRRVLQVTYDGNHIQIPPGYFRTEYAAALHMAKHLIVPGTRNIEVGGHVSWIAVLGSDDGRVAVDPVEWCQPFSDEDLATYGEAIEAIDRKALSDPSARDVEVIKTGVAAARSRGQLVDGLRPDIRTDAQASDVAREMAAHVFEPPAESMTRQAEQEAASERGSAPRQGRARAK